ncbi:MAG TPA: LanC-like protein [Polyangiaceae bacterium]|nr:LanC-like protein [Polyangiaceae bacterium]
MSTSNISPAMFCQSQADACVGDGGSIPSTSPGAWSPAEWYGFGDAEANNKVRGSRSMIDDDQALLPQHGDLSGEVLDERRFVNTFPDFDALPVEQARHVATRIHARIDLLIPALMVELRSKIGPIAEASDPRFNQPDFTLYAGAGGLALALWAAAVYFDERKTHPDLAATCLADAYRALGHALDLAEADRASSTGFYCGAAGVHAIAARMQRAKNPTAAAEHTRRVLGALDRALEQPETEILYGRSGYLYSLLDLRRCTDPRERTPDLENALAVVFDALIREGASLGAELSRQFPDNALAKSPLAYCFPAKQGAVYFGAGHGLAGVLYVLLHFPERCLHSYARESIAGALDFLVSIQNREGNFPTDLRGHRWDLFHWCHGAPGVVPTLCKAYEVFGEARYLDAAQRAADAVWSSGLLRKGVGICHGIAGSALSLLTMHRTTRNERDLYRALRMCEATWSEPCLAVIRQSHDPQRYRPGSPDLPYSLMEGKAGLLYAYVAMQRPDQGGFPGYAGAG